MARGHGPEGASAGAAHQSVLRLAGGNCARRQDSETPKVQTLFFPDRLEPKLSAIHGAARTLQQDAGIAALYCAVGFLEWYEV